MMGYFKMLDLEYDAETKEVIEKKGGAHLESFRLFDLYEGEQIRKGFKSVAYSIVFRAKGRTLEDYYDLPDELIAQDPLEDRSSSSVRGISSGYWTP